MPDIDFDNIDEDYDDNICCPDCSSLDCEKVEDEHGDYHRCNKCNKCW